MKAVDFSQSVFVPRNRGIRYNIYREDDIIFIEKTRKRSLSSCRVFEMSCLMISWVFTKAAQGFSRNSCRHIIALPRDRSIVPPGVKQFVKLADFSDAMGVTKTVVVLELDFQPYRLIVR